MNVATLPSTERIIPLAGGCNFRDIGGYAASDGRTVRWGKVYRAGVLSYFSTDDHPSLARLGIRAICDLRREEERRREPTRWPDASALGLSWDDGTAVPAIRNFAARHADTAAGMREAMIELYGALPLWLAPRIRGLFECISQDQLPLVVHCAAGKDRTGIAIAVLLSALGVPRASVIEDYLLTNDAGNFEQFIVKQRHSQLGLADAHRPLLSLPDDVRRVLFTADTDYLQSALDRIDAELGGIAGYVATHLQIDGCTLQQIQERLLGDESGR